MDLRRFRDVVDLTGLDHPSKRQKTSRDVADSTVQTQPDPPFAYRSEYTIAWICALYIEMAAAEAMLDEKHETLPNDVDDNNTYILGSIKQHYVVITCLPEGYYGTINAASVLSNLKRSFPLIRAGLMVGIGGGVPSKIDVRLGDVIVGTRVMQYDLGKIIGDGEILRTAIPRIPHQLLCTAVSALRTKHEREGTSITSILEERFKQNSDYNRPNLLDELFLSTYNHQSSTSSCQNCDISKLVPRSKRNGPLIHYGAIASGNQVMRSASQRDAIAGELDVICFEMEAAGLMDIIPCLPIRGICDYADAHKNKSWQKYAAATAAAYAREFLSVLPLSDIRIRPSCMTAPCLQASDSHQQRVLQALNFDRKDFRQAAIKAAHSKTCRWFIKHSAYQAWLDPIKLAEHHGFLWIRGKPGAGKSTLMKFAYSNMRNVRQTLGLTASFFFNARGEDLEKSIEGMYRSLTLQLLKGYPRLQSVLNNQDFNTESPDECPSLDILKNIFHDAVSSLGHDHFTCFIDALDECDEQQVMDMVQYFEDLAEHSADNNISFRVCFSSRHYPYIFVRRGIEFTLENQPDHAQDLATYVESRLRVQDPIVSNELRSKLLEKASGVFLWVILVVDILNNEHARGGMALRRRLDEIPSGLHELFSDMLRRDSINRESLLICVLWILCARRPLRPDEFSHALWSGLLMQDLADSEPPNLTETGAELSAERYVIGSSKGLAEVTKTKNPRVQFIHESVSDFLLKSGGLQQLWPDLGFEWRIQSHEKLKQCCQVYMNHDSVHLGTKAILLRDSASSPSNISSKYPFLEYASQSVLYHAELAAEGIPQDGFLSRFNTREWISTVNYFEKYRLRRFTADASLIYILAEKDCPNLIHTVLSEHPTAGITVKGERFCYPIFTALAHRNKASVAALLHSPSTIVDGTDVTQGLFLIEDFKNFKRRTPLTWAAQEGRVGLLSILLQIGAIIDERDGEGCSALKRAFECNKAAAVTYLINNNADVDIGGLSGPTALHEASKMGSEAAVRLLIERGAEVNARDLYGSTALHEASVSKSEATVRLLIENGAEVNARNSNGSTALHRASVSESEAIARLLIENGARFKTRDYKGHTALHSASEGGFETTTRLLIENGAGVNARDSYGATALHLASKGGFEAIVRLLIENGADINIQDSNGATALHSALEGKFDTIAEVLVGFNDLDSDGATTLDKASKDEFLEVVRVLVENGAEVNARDSGGATALDKASKYKFLEVVRVLTENGAELSIDLQ